MRSSEEHLQAGSHGGSAGGPMGHDHFWQRGLSRRQFIGTAATAGAALGLAPHWTAFAAADPFAKLPNAIRGGTAFPPFLGGPRHFYFPTAPNPVGATAVIANDLGDPATIRDFRGSVGVVEFPPTGVVTGDSLGGKFWAADIRFYSGQFVGRDNRKHHGTLAFV